MTKNFCPICGSTKVVDVFCLEHLKEQHPLIKAFKDFTAEVCATSGAVRYKGRWHPSTDPAATIKAHFAEQIVPAPYAEIKTITLGPLTLQRKPGLTEKGIIAVHVQGRASPKSSFYTESYDVPYTVTGTVAPKLRKHADYFEGTLQVRNEDEASTAFITAYVAKHGARITKTQREGHGTNYFLTSKAVVLHLAKALQERYGGLMKTSRTLFSRNRQRSKDIYRATAFIELPPFTEGAVISQAEKPLLVLERGKRIKYYNLATGKTEYHRYTGTERPLAQRATSIASTRPALTIIHPDNYQAVPAANKHCCPHEPGDEVNVVLHNDKAYLVERC